MFSSFSIRRQVEVNLANRIPSALTPAQRVIRAVTRIGIDALDAMLRGGLPCAGITEVVGPECSGRTTVGLGYVQALTEADMVCAWVDVSDGLDPESASANGVDLERLLWVRCGAPLKIAVIQPKPVADETPVAKVPAVSGRHVGSGSPHPRSEGRHMPQAITAMLQAHGGLYQKQLRREKRSVGTPGAVNRPLSQSSPDREEQVATDRLPARRGEKMIAPHAYAAPCVETQSPRLPGAPRAPLTGEVRHMGKTWQALEQALRATDMLLQGGGFSAIVLDLGSTPAEFAWRIPLATWFRFRAACEQSRVSLVLLTQHPCARSSAELVVRMEAGRMEADGKVMTGVLYQAAVERQRLAQQESNSVSIRRPPQAERAGHWRSEATWARTR